ncbi:MAG: DUF6653 family protein [Pseudomonadota bacterium]
MAERPQTATNETATAAERMAVKSMGMSEAVWERHANPWSAGTRLASFPLFILAGWSPHWIGLWSVLPIALVAIWAWLNPRLFPPPKRRDSWMTHVTFGERVWLRRDEVPIPRDHAVWARRLTYAGVAGLLAWIAGAVLGNAALYLTGAATAFWAKLWFCDRMVWLYRDMKVRNDTYRRWEYPCP